MESELLFLCLPLPLQSYTKSTNRIRTRMCFARLAAWSRALSISGERRVFEKNYAGHHDPVWWNRDKVSPTKLHAVQNTCTCCQKCANVCPVQIDVCAQPKVTSSQCLSCGDCVAACPQSDCLEPQVAGKFRMKWAVYGVAALVLFFTPVLISKQAGAWKSGTTATEKVTDSAGMKNPYYLRGSMGLKEACDEFQIPLDRFIMAFNLPMDIDTNMRMEDVATVAGVSMRDLKEFAAQYVMQRDPGITFDNSGEGIGHGGQGEH